MGGIDITTCLMKKKGLKEYQKNYLEIKKSQYNNESNNFLIMILIVYVVIFNYAHDSK